MHHLVNGRKVHLPVKSDGSISSDIVRQIAGVPQSRALVLQRSDGSNIVVNPGQTVQVRPLDSFVDAPIHTRG